MSKGKLLAVSMVWLVILLIGVVCWKVWFGPSIAESNSQRAQAEAEAARAAREAELRRGGSDSRYQTQVSIALDGFSGYAVLRSPEFAGALRDQGIKLTLKDDGADYTKRLAALARGEVDMAVFTIDALVKTCAESNSLPATIVAVIDETVGADAIVSYKEVFANVDALNTPETRFVLTPNSPSETLARVVMSRFQLDQLPENPFIEMRDAAEVVAKYKKSKPTDPVAYVVWEPYITQMLKNDRVGVIVDSSRFPATIVDVLVASDDYIAKNSDTATALVRAYLQANYKYRTTEDRIALIMKDAAADAALTHEEATRLVDGVWWKNTQENLAHAGIRNGTRLPHLEDIIAGITRVLIDSGSIERDPTDGNPNYLYNDNVLRELADFHPGVENEEIRGTEMPALSDAQWSSLVEAGTAKAPTLIFARGTPTLTERSRKLLDELAGTLQSTRYYVIVRGNASLRGDAAANKKLAEQRALEVERYLSQHGVDTDRIRAVGVEPSGSTSVSFLLGEVPY